MPGPNAKTPEPPEVEEVDESSDESFPASDPPSWAMGKRTEPSQHRDEPPRSDRPNKPDAGRAKHPGGQRG